MTIYHEDCAQVVPFLDKFDLLLTDPPYGIGLDTARTKSWDNKTPKWPGARLTNDYGVNEWDQRIDPQLLELVRSKCESHIIFGGHHYDLPSTSCYLVWDKETGASTFADCELAWTNLKKAVRRIRYLWNGFQKAMPEPRWHPTQKPLVVMKWCILQAEPIATILDPFAGSGTSGRAAKDLGKKAILIEREERYCEIAAKRMEQEAFDFSPPLNGHNEEQLEFSESQ